MGLDMYARVYSKEDALSETSVVPNPQHPSIELYYWRKHYALHDWMEGLFRKKGGTGVFNCQLVLLTLDDLDELESNIKSNKFADSYDSHDADLQFVKKARDTIKSGNGMVYYDSWW